MKILFFRESEIKDLNPDVLKNKGLGGTESSFILLAQGLSQYNEVKVYCPCIFRKKYEKVEYISFLDYSDFIVQIEKFLPDIIIIVGNPTILFKPVFEQRTNKFKIIFWQHNHPEEMKAFPIQNLLRRKNVEIIFPSIEASDYAKKIYNNDSKIFGIYNPIRQEFLEQKYIKKIKNKICYLSSFSKNKGLFEFLSICKDLKEYQINLLGDFNIYGKIDKDYFNKCSLLLTENIILKGNLSPDNVVYELASSEICIANPIIGNKETCCMVVLESMVLGVPVIAGGKSLIDSIVSHGGISYTKDLANCIKKLMQDLNKKEVLSKSGKEWAQQFSIEKVSQKWNEFL